ncbi:hypothetical protein [Consotaella salsifontis]|uniref:Uncharacterized protein n=1 Tax=Consotaella salsifontis TaxID=1365950 RepID=A0A1T4RRA3_9HYPH|nr:hypothetical protein [Consotaella salsifontis]SKA18555.1 hypothetical protein SAMN05428963_107205 [Consotaella salsifontis]
MPVGVNPKTSEKEMKAAMKPALWLLFCLVVLVPGLSACGRRNAPVRPNTQEEIKIDPDKRTTPQTTSAAAVNSTIYSILDDKNEAARAPEIRRNPKAQKKSFILDPLLN